MYDDERGNIEIITVDEIADILDIHVNLESDDEKTRDDIYYAKKYYGQNIDSDFLYKHILKCRVLNKLQTIFDRVKGE